MGVRRRWAVLTIAAGSAALLATQVGYQALASSPTSAPVAAGTASAGAALVGVVPQVSGLTLTVTLGEADAAYEENESQAKSGIVDLGGLGYFLSGLGFCGAPGVPLSEQPQPITVDSESGPSSQTTDVAGQGEEHVSVSGNPEQASATTAPDSETIPGLLQVSGTEQASVHYITNTEQEAESSVVENVNLLNGLIELNGLSWSASREVGRINKSSTNFSLGQVEINHVPLSPTGISLASEVALINDVIGVLGFTLSLPTASSVPEDGSLAMGPLVLEFSGSQVDRSLLGPAVGAVTQLEDALAAASQASSMCTTLPELLYNIGNSFDGLINLVLATAQGAGGLFLDLGGANVSIQSLPNLTNPLGTGPLGTGPLGTGPLSVGLGGLSTTSGTSAGNPTSPAAANATPLQTTTPPASGGQSSSSTPSTGPSSSVTTPATRGNVTVAGLVVCKTTSQSGSPGCWRGLGSLAAGVTIAAGAGLFAADIVYGRRRRRRRRRNYA